MPIMKLTTHGGTSYFLHPERVVDIYDSKVTDPVTKKKVDGCYVQFQHQGSTIAVGVPARALKRSIQENTDVEIGFLKLTLPHQSGNRYVNVDNIIELHIPNESGGLLSSLILDNKDGAFQNVSEITIRAPTDPLQVALQLRRVINRLDQDEELCCNAPTAPAEEEEEGDHA